MKKIECEVFNDKGSLIKITTSGDKAFSDIIIFLKQSIDGRTFDRDVKSITITKIDED